MRRLVLGFVSALSLASASAATLPAEALARDPARWPAEASVTQATRASVIVEGKPAGAILLGAGRQLTVLQVGPGTVTGRIGGTVVEVPLDRTDVLARAAAAATEPVPTPNTTTTSPVPAPAPISRADPPLPDEPPTPLQTAFTGKLVVWSEGAVRPYDARRLNGVKFYALYFSASWCGPCREFTPELVRDYAALKQLYPEFELIFVSSDQSEADMHGYLRDDAMPWPALRFADRRQKEAARHAGRGIPCLVLVDSDGKELAHSYRRGRYVGPAQVVEDTWKILKAHRRSLAGR